MKSLFLIGALLVSSLAFAQGECCEGGAKKVAKVSQADAAFMAEAHKMAMAAESKQACCKSTATRAMAKGDKGCCNEVGVKAKYKVYADGKYSYYGCKDSAAQGRKEMLAKGVTAGRVQVVRSRSTRIG